MAEPLGFFVIDPLPVLAASKERKDRLYVPYDRNHPSEAGHRLIAQAIVDDLNRNGRREHPGTSRTARGGALSHMAKGPKNPERSFGVSVGGVLIVIALLLWWRGRVGRAEILGGIGGVLLFFGVVQPRLLKWPSAVWWRFARRARRTSTRAFC